MDNPDVFQNCRISNDGSFYLHYEHDIFFTDAKLSEMSITFSDGLPVSDEYSLDFTYDENDPQVYLIFINGFDYYDCTNNGWLDGAATNGTITVARINGRVTAYWDMTLTSPNDCTVHNRGKYTCPN